MDKFKWKIQREKQFVCYSRLFFFMEIYFDVASDLLTVLVEWIRCPCIAYALGFTLAAFHSGISRVTVSRSTMTAYPSKLAIQKHAFTTIKPSKKTWSFGSYQHKFKFWAINYDTHKKRLAQTHDTGEIERHKWEKRGKKSSGIERNMTRTQLAKCDRDTVDVENTKANVWTGTSEREAKSRPLPH